MRNIGVALSLFGTALFIYHGKSQYKSYKFWKDIDKDNERT